MKHLSALTVRYMWKNRPRTVTTLMGVFLSALMIFLLFEVTYSVVHSLENYEVRKTGGQDVSFRVDADMAIRMREDAEKSRNGRNEDRVLAGVSVDKLWLEMMTYNHCLMLIDDFSEVVVPFELDRGVLPTSESEVMIQRDYLEEKYDLEDMSHVYIPTTVGSNMEIYQYVNGARREPTGDVRIISGFLRKSEYIYLAFTPCVGLLTEDALRNAEDTVCVNMVLSDRKGIGEQIGQIAEAYGVAPECVEQFTGFDDGAEYGVLVLDAILLLFTYFISVILMIVIRNAFNISVDERLMDYGVLRCIGLTRKQIVRMLVFEAFLLVLMGSFLGILVGYGITVLGLKLVSGMSLMKDLVGIGFSMQATSSIKPILIASGAAFITTTVSMISPVEKLFRMNPIDAQKKREKVRRPKGRGLLESKMIKKGRHIELAYGIRSAKRIRGRYTRTIVAYALGLALVVGFGTVIRTAERTEYPALWQYDVEGMVDCITEDSGGSPYDPKLWYDAVRALDLSKNVRGAEGGIVYTLNRMVEDSENPRGVKLQPMIELTGVTGGIWNLICERTKIGNPKSISGEIPVISVIMPGSSETKYQQGDSFSVKHSDMTFYICASVEYRKIKRALDTNGIDLGDAYRMEEGTYLYLADPDHPVFDIVQPEVILSMDRMDGGKVNIYDAGLLGSFKAEAVYGKTAELIREMQKWTEVVNEVEATPVAILKSVRNAIMFTLVFILLIMVINTINVERGLRFARQDELIVLRAIGLSKKQQRKMLLAENMSGTVIAVVLGIVVGLMLAGLFALLFYRGNGLLGGFQPESMIVSFSPDWVTILIGAGVLLLSSVIVVIFSRDTKRSM